MTVTSDDQPADKGVSAATPDDPNIADGFYWLFSSLTGPHPFTATKSPYAPVTKTVHGGGGLRSCGPTSPWPASRLTVTPTTIETLPDARPDPEHDVTVTQHRQRARRRWSCSSAAATSRSSPAAGCAVADDRDAGRRVEGALRAEGRTSARPAANQPCGRSTRGRRSTTPRRRSPTTRRPGSTARSTRSVARDRRRPDRARWSTTRRPRPGRRCRTCRPVGRSRRPRPSAASSTCSAAGERRRRRWPRSTSSTRRRAVEHAAGDQPEAARGGGRRGGRRQGATWSVAASTVPAPTSDTTVEFDPAAGSFSEVAPYPHDVAWMALRRHRRQGLLRRRRRRGDLHRRLRLRPGSPTTWTPIATMPADRWGSSETAAGGLLVLAGGVTERHRHDHQRDDRRTTRPPTPGRTCRTRTSSRYRGAAACGVYKVGGLDERQHPDRRVRGAGRPGRVRWRGRRPVAVGDPVDVHPRPRRQPDGDGDTGRDRGRGCPPAGRLHGGDRRAVEQPVPGELGGRHDARPAAGELGQDLRHRHRCGLRRHRCRCRRSWRSRCRPTRTSRTR